MRPELAEIKAEVEASLQARAGNAEAQTGEVPEEQSAVGVQEQTEEQTETPEEPAEVQIPEVDEQRAVTLSNGEVVNFVNQIPEVLGVEPETFYSLPIVLKNGDEPIPLGEVKERLQVMDGERQQLQQQREQLMREQAHFQQQAMGMGQQQNAMTQRMQAAQEKLNLLQGQVQSNAARWEALKESNPGQVAAERQDLGMAIQNANAEMQAAGQEAMAQRQQAVQSWRAQQHQYMAQALPEWSDPQKRQGLQQELSRFAIDRYHYSPQELSSFDWRLMMMARDAMIGKQLQDEGAQAVKKVNSLPPVIPRSQRRKAAVAQTAQVAELENRARATGKSQDKLAAARAIFQSQRQR